MRFESEYEARRLEYEARRRRERRWSLIVAATGWIVLVVAVLAAVLVSIALWGLFIRTVC